MQTIQTIKELKQAIRKAKAVFVGTLICSEDPTYIQAVKADILEQIDKLEDTSLSFIRLDNDGYLYIN